MSTQSPPAWNIEPPTKATLAKYGFGNANTGWDSPEDDWQALLESQGWVCPICGKVPTPNKTTGKVRFVVDHDHVKGWKAMPPERRRLYVRGLTCWWCNGTYLGRGITPEKCENAARYLRAYLERRPA